ncbi:tetratricopeptide repeat protein [Roseofilum casamattae]|uniref:Tetratricopeptide repeat protein n=1 Tax=Roseofilum casamattae BLCC-M143 TaxID=3022442 RepID=A0ABT7BT53_9CYAN|nr:tetratricopeptide repeat protein [Roseofilum casamattae]MDJ1182255.1 tetratricopeptide repeat protein [Roseofilum casamattae BLCC-M143]
MLTKLWRWLGNAWQWLRGIFRQTPPLEKKTATPARDTDYEMRFMALLEEVYQGKDRVREQWQGLQDEHPEAEWVAWLQRFGETLPISGKSNRELGDRLIRLGKVGCGDLGIAAARLGERLASQESEVEPTPDTPPSMEPEGEDKDNPQAWLDRAQDLLDRDPSQALEACDRALALDENLERGWIYRGNALSNLGDYEKAIAAYDRALQLQPQSDLALANRGNSLFDLERYEEAIASWDCALEINPQDSETLHNKGMALGLKLQQWQEAIACFDRLLELDPNDAQTHFQRGIGLAALQRWEEALDSWDRSTDLQPDFQDAWINKGVVLQRLGRYAEAISANQRAIQSR